MDSDVEKLQSLLLDSNLPSTIHDLKNPTEDFVINLIITFLTRFKIDVNSINKVNLSFKYYTKSKLK